jgi:hypothetical protein
MRKQIYISLVTLSLFVALAVMPVHAQIQDAIRVSIPFAFVVGDKTMPAGEYTIKSLVNGSYYSRLLVRSKDGHDTVIVGAGVVEAKSVQRDAKLTFNRYGDQHFLSQVWAADSTYGRSLSKSDIEARVAQNSSQKDTVSVIVRYR